jgi:undecaprenyl-phosphate 4-deoxy-4-formamido-L-arabinose transferase
MEPPAASLSIVVPVYNSEPMLPELVRRLAEVLSATGREFELVLVDDDSADGSWQAAEQLAATHDWVRGARLRRNFGQHNALLAGIRMARNEIVVTMDDDLQNPPEEIPKLLSQLDRGYDVVYGTPAREQHGVARDLASRITKLALRGALGAATAGKVSAFRAFRRDLRDAFADYQSHLVSIDVLLTWATRRFSAVEVRHEPRHTGASNYTLRKLVVHALNMMTGFSVLPLQLASVIGFVFTVFGSLVLAYVLGRYLIEGTTVPGFPFLASLIAIFSGAQLFALGIIGEYLARMHYRTMGRPAYVVSAVTSENRSA